MFRVLFVCSANVCRSPLAECVMRDMAERAGMGGDVVADSAGVRPDYGCGIHPGTIGVLGRNGIPWTDRSARALSPYEYGDWDMISCMDGRAAAEAALILGGDPDGRISVFGGTGIPADCLRDMDSAYRSAVRGCAAILERIADAGKDC